MFVVYPEVVSLLPEVTNLLDDTLTHVPDGFAGPLHRPGLLCHLLPDAHPGGAGQ